MSINFFDKFWKPYLEYEVFFESSESQIKEEIKDLDLKKGEVVGNIGINWGQSIEHMFEACPEIEHVYGIDSSDIMFRLSMDVFSQENYLKNWCGGLSQAAISFLDGLHREARKYHSKTSFIFSSAEELHKKGLRLDKIAATTGFHWLENPQTIAFRSMNKSLNIGGLVTFSSASALFEVENPQESFILNPYYTKFFEILEKLTKGKFQKDKERKKYNFSHVKKTIEDSGFNFERYRESRMEITKEMIGEVCKGGIKFFSDYDARNETIKEHVEEALKRVRDSLDYDESNARYEICPIFTIRKIKDIKA